MEHKILQKGVSTSFNLHDFNILYNFPEWKDFAMIMKAIFVAPESGDYIFYIGCDDVCRLFIGSDDQESSAYEIAHNPSSVGRLIFTQ